MYRLINKLNYGVASLYVPLKKISVLSVVKTTKIPMGRTQFGTFKDQLCKIVFFYYYLRVRGCVSIKVQRMISLTTEPKWFSRYRKGLSKELYLHPPKINLPKKKIEPTFSQPFNATRGSRGALPPFLYKSKLQI